MKAVRFGIACAVAAVLASCGSGSKATRTTTTSGATSGVGQERTVVTPPTLPHHPPTVLLKCPGYDEGPWDWYDASFAHYVFLGGAPIARYDIDYGDGRHYSNTSDAQVFEHRYEQPGSFTVTVVVTDAANLQGTASCTFSWGDTGGGYGNSDGTYGGNGGGPTRCRDGWVSNSSGRGTCSHHGGEA